MTLLVPKLILKHDGVNLRTYPLQAETVTLGRKPDNDIQIDDAAISGHHARFVKQPSEYLEDHFDVYIEDLGSTNGTRVNEAAVDRQLLKHGDTIQIGKHSFTFDSGQSDLDETAFYLPDS
jgi:pSer/pThr/pTyr-binding forkhead associated (FHA) protein